MFPGIYGFAWDAGHIIFLGVFYSVLAVVAATMVIALQRAARAFRMQRAEVVRWHADFDDLPERMRRCRHELAGEVEERVCHNCFDCRHCEEHGRFMARERTPLSEAGEPMIGGFSVPADRLYHRGHTWVQLFGDGTATVGLDDLAGRIMASPDEVRLPVIGSRVTTNGTAWVARRNGVDVRVLAPIDGEVIAVGGPNDSWYLKLNTEQSDTRHLLTPREAKGWMLRELERLQLALSSEGVGAALADGGVPVADLGSAIPPSKFDDVCAAVFLDP